MKTMIALLVICTSGYFGYFYLMPKPFSGLVLNGRLISQDRQYYLNERTLVAFRGEPEIARSLTATRPGFNKDVVDNGTFSLVVRLPYTITKSDIQIPGMIASQVFGDDAANSWLKVDMGDVSEIQRLTEIRIPTKKDAIVIAVLGGKNSSVKPILDLGRLGLAGGRNLYLSEAAWRRRAPRPGLDLLVRDVGETSQSIETRVLTYNNCTGNNAKTVDWTIDQMFPIYTSVYKETFISLEPSLTRDISKSVKGTSLFVPEHTSFGSYREVVSAVAPANSRLVTTINIQLRLLEGTVYLRENPADTSGFWINNGIKLDAQNTIGRCTN